jgi:hypothetical protein
MSTRRSPLNGVAEVPAAEPVGRYPRWIRAAFVLAVGAILSTYAGGTAGFADTTTTVPGDTTTTTTTPTTLPLSPNSSTTTTSTSSTTSTTSTTAPANTTSTTQPKKANVPKVPVGSPTTTTPKGPPPPPPDPGPILSAVDEDLDQLQAIADYKPAQAMVAKAQQQVTQASATLQSARFVLQQAEKAQLAAGKEKEYSDAKLRDLALAAYIGVGYSTPGFGGPGGNGNEGFGTVSTPGGLTGIEALDAKEMLQIVGERAVQFHNEATQSLNQAVRMTAAARSDVQKADGVVAAAEQNLLNAQQTLKLVTAAAVTPGTAAATQLPVLASDQGGALPPSATTTTPATTSSPQISQAPPTTTNPAANLVAAAEQNAPALIANPTSPTILGTPVLSADELAAWYDSTGRKANTTVPIAQLAQYYQAWGAKTGVRDDLAFAQSIVETGFFGFPAGGQLTGTNNNFAGIGACDSCAHGWSFPTANAGVGAQMQLLDAYASSKPVDTSLVGNVGVGGCCTTWTDLAGTWASSLTYGISIMTIYDQMLKWAMPERMVTAGLIAPTQTSADQGPELAPLPPGPPQPKPPASPSATAPHR